MEPAGKTPAREALALSSDELRSLGYRIVDMLVEHDRTLRDKTVTRILDWEDSKTKLGEPFAEEGVPPDVLLEKLEHQVFSTMMHVNHPRFFAFVPGPGNMVAAFAEALAAGYNVFAGTWMEGSGPATVELVTIDWLRQVCGLPESTAGLFVSGGSVANLTALAVARRVKLGDDFRDGVAYFSDQTHSAVERAFRVLGFSSDQIRKLASDDDYRLPLADLRRQVEEDRVRNPFPRFPRRGQAVVRGGDLIPGSREDELQQAGDMSLVVDHQHPRLTSGHASFGVKGRLTQQRQVGFDS